MLHSRRACGGALPRPHFFASRCAITTSITISIAAIAIAALAVRDLVSCTFLRIGLAHSLAGVLADTSTERRKSARCAMFPIQHLVLDLVLAFLGWCPRLHEPGPSVIELSVSGGAAAPKWAGGRGEMENGK